MRGGVFVPYVPTPPPVVRRMLELAKVGPEDIVYDLGCGDGRILLTAVKEFKAKKAVGIEKREDLVKEAKKNISREGLSERIEIIPGDMFEIPIRDATVVTLFLLPSVNDLLKPKFSKELRPGTRIVSHEFKISGWKPIVEEEVREGYVRHKLYLYIVGESNI